MPPSFEQLFINKVVAAAARCAADTGLWTSVVLAQWADETAWGTSRAWLYGNNPAGVSPGGKIASYPSQAAGFAAYVQTMGLKYYEPVRDARPLGAVAQALALGRSPWAGGHYTAEGGIPGSSLVGIIGSMDLTAYDGAEQTLNPQPQPKQEDEDDMTAAFIAQESGGSAEFVIWPEGSKSFIAQPADTAALLKQFGQSGAVQLTAATLSQIPSKQLPAGAPQPPES